MKKFWLALLCVGSLVTVGVYASAGGGGVDCGEGCGAGAGRFAQGPVYERPVRADGLVEVLVDGVQREIYHARGRSYVEALRGAEYSLRVRNPYPVRVAVALSVDGLNTIDARRTSRWDSSKWVIEPYGSVTIGGWQMSRERARRFYFTNERDAYASRLGRPSDLGVISAVFYRERAAGGGVITPRPYPSGEPRARGESEERAADNTAAPSSAPRAQSQARSNRSPQPSPAPEDDYAATGIGRSVQHDVSWVHLDLDPRPAAEVTLRYEYRDALVRLGVLPRPYTPSPDPLRRRERATGFEGERYSPEP